MRTVRFGDLLEQQVRNGVYKAKEFHGSGVRVVNMKELFAYEFLSDQADARVELTPTELLKSELRDGDLLFARRSFVLEGAGKCSLVIDPPEALTFESSMIRARPNPDVADSRFLYYYFKSPVGRSRMASIAARTAVSGITGSNLSALTIDVPDVTEQRRISGVLLQFDELMENCRRRVRALEEMARVVYEEWFVRYRYPGNESARCIDSSLGSLPKGWTVGVLGDLAFEVRESTKPSEATRSLPYVPIDEIDSRSLTLSRSRSGEDAASSLRMFKEGDVLFGAMRAYFHKVCVAPFDGVTRSTCLVLRGKPGWRVLPLFYLDDHESVAYASNHSTGSTIPYAKWNGSLSERPVALPPLALAGEFSDVAEPMLAQARGLARQATVLAALRDQLLPKLVTGQIRPSKLDLDDMLKVSAA